MKLTTTIRVGLTDPLYNAIRAASKRTGTSVAGLARAGIEKHLARLGARGRPAPMRKLDEVAIASRALAR